MIWKGVSDPDHQVCGIQDIGERNPWIWQKQSNDVRLLQQWNCHVWDEWMREDGTIGKAYGYQLGKYHQVDTLLETLKKILKAAVWW